MPARRGPGSVTLCRCLFPPWTPAVPCTQALPSPRPRGHIHPALSVSLLTCKMSALAVQWLLSTPLVSQALRGSRGLCEPVLGLGVQILGYADDPGGCLSPAEPQFPCQQAASAPVVGAL